VPVYSSTPGPTDATRYTIIYLTLMGWAAVRRNAMERTSALDSIEPTTDDLDDAGAEAAEVIA